MNNLNYRAMKIIVGNNCNCVLSKHTGKRLLYSEVLELLKNYNSVCSCTFKHFKDQRQFDRDNLTLEPHGRTIPYGRQVVDIHNRARDPFVNVRTGTTFTALHKQNNLRF
jgi:hypothetical protein